MITSLYRLLLRAYPASFLADYEHEMVWAFEQQLARRRRRLDRVGLFAIVALDLVASAANERRTSMAPVMQPVAGSPVDGAARAPFRASRGQRLTAVAPMWLGLPLSLAIPGNLDILFSKPPDILGVPAAVVFVLVGLVWAVYGAAIVWRARYQLAAVIAIVVFALPSLVLIVLGPALLRIGMSTG